MSNQRPYGYTTVFNAPIVNMRHLWEPSTEYLGKKSEKPNYFGTFIVRKTRQNWWEEPQFAGLAAACTEVLNKAGMQPQHIAVWPVKDGDIPEPSKTVAEWAKGAWIFGGSSNNPINVAIVQNGQPVPLTNRAGVKPGDLCAVGISVTFKKQSNREFKVYMNSVLFMAQGEEIAVGNGVTAAELMKQAQAQGLNVAGFSTGPGGFGGAPQGGFQPTPGQQFGAPMQQGFPQPGGFNGATGVTAGPQTGPGGFAPSPNGPATAYPSNGGYGAPQGPQMGGFGGQQAQPNFGGGSMPQGGFPGAGGGFPGQ